MRRALTWVLCLSTLGVAGIALADPVVVVHAAGNTEGVVIVLTDPTGVSHTCTTDATGSCELTGVVPGSVFVESRRPGAPPAGRHAFIPADGKVSLIVPDA